MADGSTMHCDAIMLTALPVEFQSVRAHLQNVQEVVHPETGTIYQVGNVAGSRGIALVAVTQIGMEGPAAASETERAIHFFAAPCMFFMGVAGGLKGVSHGDVVVSTRILRL